MAWTAPRTWTTGELVTAAIMNTHVRDNLSAIGRPTKGGVTSVGAVEFGSGFTAAKTATGRYTVTFSTAYSARPSVVCTPTAANNAAFQISTYEESATLFKVAVGDSSGVAADLSFAFIAMEV